MTGTNPYTPSQSAPTAQTGPPRTLFVAFHILIVAFVVVVLKIGLAGFDAPEYYNTPVGELPFLGAVNRVASSYWFVPVFLLLVLDVLVFLVLRRMCDGPVRRRWFVISTASIPIVVLLFWYTLGSTVTMGL